MQGGKRGVCVSSRIERAVGLLAGKEKHRCWGGDVTNGHVNALPFTPQLGLYSSGTFPEIHRFSRNSVWKIPGISREPGLLENLRILGKVPEFCNPSPKPLPNPPPPHPTIRTQPPHSRTMHDARTLLYHGLALVMVRQTAQTKKTQWFQFLVSCFVETVLTPGLGSILFQFSQFRKSFFSLKRMELELEFQFTS